MSNRDPEARYVTPRQTLPFVVEQMVRRLVHTSAPGIVRAYDPVTKRAEVQPALRMLFTDDREPVDRPPIVDVPVRQPATGGWLHHHAVDAGDVVLLLFTQRGIETFKEAWGELADPPAGVFFQERDAVAVPWGVEVLESVASTGIVLQSADGETYLSLQEEAVTVRRGETTITVEDDKVVLELPDAGRVYLGGETGAQQLATRKHIAETFNTHTHSTPAGPSGPPLKPPPLKAGEDITDKARSQ